VYGVDVHIWHEDAGPVGLGIVLREAAKLIRLNRS
jgi:hypothetical protein